MPKLVPTEDDDERVRGSFAPRPIGPGGVLRITGGILLTLNWSSRNHVQVGRGLF